MGTDTNETRRRAPTLRAASAYDSGVLDDVTTWQGDSRELLARVPDHSVDLICTDPPYNLGGYSTGNIKMAWRSPIQQRRRRLGPDRLRAVGVARGVPPRPEADRHDLRVHELQHARPLARGLRPGVRHVPVHRLAQDEPAAEAPAGRLPQQLRADRLLLGQGPHLELHPPARHAQLHRGARSAAATSGSKDPVHPTQKPLRVLRRLVELALEPGRSRPRPVHGRRVDGGRGGGARAGGSSGSRSTRATWTRPGAGSRRPRSRSPPRG